MYLVSNRDQEVLVTDLQTSFNFQKDEKTLTEYSYKYSQAELQDLAHASGFYIETQWLDEKGWFSLNYLKPKSSGL